MSLMFTSTTNLYNKFDPIDESIVTWRPNLNDKHCPCCKSILVVYRFSTDGHIIETFHCFSCGDVIL